MRFPIMTLETYGLQFDAYKELFLSEAAHLLYLYYEFEMMSNEQSQHLYGWSKLCEKTRYDLFSDAIYSTNDRARAKQKKENPETVKDDYEFMSLGTKEIKEEIQAINAKIEALVDYVGNLTNVIKAGLTDLADTPEGGA